MYRTTDMLTFSGFYLLQTLKSNLNNFHVYRSQKAFLYHMPSKCICYSQQNHSLNDIQQLKKIGHSFYTVTRLINKIL